VGTSRNAIGSAGIISSRTKAALAAAKARGVKLGGPKLKQAQWRGVASNKANADRFAANVLPIIQQIKASGATSLRAIAKALNARGIATARGGVWTPVQVTAVQRRAETLRLLLRSAKWLGSAATLRFCA
jgi:DNA invertase Pin-like site-specific DNA recombinase